MPINPPTLTDLKRETPESEIKQRPMFKDKRPTGKSLSYVDARYVMDTLDDVVGPENWRDEYKVLTGGAVECTIHIYVNHGEDVASAGWVSKSDVGVPSTIEPQKGAYSDAFKRAADKWGIARDLYEEREDEGARGPRDQRPIRERDEDDLPFEDDEDEPPRRSVRTSTRGASASRGRSNASAGRRPTGSSRMQERVDELTEAYDLFMEGWDDETSPWFCPDHDSVKVLPPGIGKTSGKAYGAFLACDEKGCQEKGPWVEDLLKQQGR
jgi:hypothetical protein